jgi:hypothetical protein
MRKLQFGLKLFFLLVVVVAVVGLFAVRPLLHSLDVQSELAKGLNSLRSLEESFRKLPTKHRANGAGVVVTAWTNVFTNSSKVNVGELKLIVSRLQEYERDPDKFQLDEMRQILQEIVTANPSCKQYVESIALKNLELSFRSKEN